MNIFLLQAVDVLPSADPLPLPAPPFLMIFLMFLTFVLHMIAMNFTVGGTIFQVIHSFRGGENLGKHSKFLTSFLPVSMSFTVTLGIAPLLFLQVLYGQIFFTTSVLMAWIWLFVIVALLIAYYSIYVYMYNHEKSMLARRGAPLLSLVLLLVIGFIFVMNSKLFFMADQWEQIYQTSNGLFLNTSQPQVWPSMLHYLTAMVAFGGLLLFIHGWTKSKSDKDYSKWAARIGGLTYAIPTGLQFIFGILLLLALPRDVMNAFMFGEHYATHSLLTGMLLALVSLILMLVLAVKRSYGLLAWLGVGSSFLILAPMTMVRGYVRDVMTKNLVDPATFTVETQWLNIILFGVLLVAGLATVGWMLWHVFFGKNQEEVATEG
jgi:hypothetical protein